MKHGIAMVALASALVLVGCGKEDAASPDAAASQSAEATSAPTMEEARQAALRLDRPDPGQYEQKVEVTRFEAPGLTAQQSEEMRKMMAAQQVRSFCLTPADTEQGFKDMFDEVGKDGECAYSRFNVAGGKIDAQMDCRNSNGETAIIAIAGAVTGQGSDVTVDIDQSQPAVSGKTRIGMHLTTKRTGDCAG